MAKNFSNSYKYTKRTTQQPVMAETTTERVKNRPQTKKADKQSALSEAMLLFERNSSLWHGLLNRRKELQFKLTRAGSLLELYKEGLNMNPVFVPQKFRQDDSFVTPQGLDKMHALNVQRFESEVANVELKIAEYKKEIKKIDDEILHKATLMSTEETIVEAVTKMIQERISEHTYRIEKECEIRAKERREAFQKDICKYLEKVKSVKYGCLKSESLGRKIDKNGNFVKRDEYKSMENKERYVYDYGDNNDRNYGDNDKRETSRERYKYQKGNKWEKYDPNEKDDTKVRYSYERVRNKTRDDVSKSYEIGDFKRRYTYDKKEGIMKDNLAKDYHKLGKSNEIDDYEEKGGYKKEEYKEDVTYNAEDYRSKLCRFNKTKRTTSGHTKKEKSEERNISTSLLRQKQDAEQVLKKAEYLTEKYGSPSSYRKKDFSTEKRVKYEETDKPTYRYHKSIEKEAIKDDILKSLTSINQRIDALEKGTSYSNDKDELFIDSRLNIDKTIESVEEDLKYRTNHEEGVYSLLSSPVKSVKDEGTLTQFSDIEPMKGTPVQVKNAIVTDSEFEGPKHESRYKYYKPSDKPISEDINAENLPYELPYSDKRICSETNIDTRYKFSTFAEKNIDDFYKSKSERRLATQPSYKDYKNEVQSYSYTDIKTDDYNHDYGYDKYSDQKSDSPIKDITNTIDKIIHRMNNSKRESREENTLYKTTTLTNLDKNIDEPQAVGINGADSSILETPLTYTSKITSSNHDKEERLSRWENRDEINMKTVDKDYSEIEPKYQVTPKQSRKMYTSYSEEKFQARETDNISQYDKPSRSLHDIVLKPTFTRRTDVQRINGVDVDKKETKTTSHQSVINNTRVDYDTPRVDYSNPRIDYNNARVDYSNTSAGYSNNRTDYNCTRADYGNARADYDNSRADYDNPRADYVNTTRTDYSNNRSDYNDTNAFETNTRTENNRKIDDNVDIVLKVKDDRNEPDQENVQTSSKEYESKPQTENINTSYVSQSVTQHEHVNTATYVSQNVNTTSYTSQNTQNITVQKHPSLESLNKSKKVTSQLQEKKEVGSGYSCELLPKKPSDSVEGLVSIKNDDKSERNRVETTLRRSRKIKVNTSSSDEGQKRSKSCSDVKKQKSKSKKTTSKEKPAQDGTIVTAPTTPLQDPEEIVVLHPQGTENEVTASLERGRSRFLRYNGKETSHVEVRTSKRIVRVDNGCLAKMNPEFAATTTEASGMAPKRSMGYVASPRYKRRTFASQILGSFGMVHK